MPNLIRHLIMFLLICFRAILKQVQDNISSSSVRRYQTRYHINAQRKYGGIKRKRN